MGLSCCRATWSRPFRKGGVWCESGRAWRVMLSCIRKPRLKGNARMMGRWRRAGAMRSRWSRVCGLVGGTGWGQGGWDKSQVAPSEIATFSTRCAIHSSCERPLCNILLTSRSARALACCHAQRRPGWGLQPSITEIHRSKGACPLASADKLRTINTCLEVDSDTPTQTSCLRTLRRNIRIHRTFRC